MPRYYFDVHNGDGLIRDEHGLELSSRARIMTETSRILFDIARDEFPGRDRGDISITVRDEGDRNICMTHLTFQTEWLIGPEK